MRIVLVETAGALNLGAIARVMSNFGLSELWLVNPRCQVDDPQAQQMAVHGQNILNKARIVPSLLDAIGDCDRVIGTAGRMDRGDRAWLSVEAGCGWLLAKGTKPAIVFGREDRGLSNAELQYFPQVMTIPSVPTSPSLNLAQAVAICCYQWRLLTLQEPLATVASMELLFKELEDLLLGIGFLYPHTAFSRMQKLRQMLHRADLTTAEVTMWRGIVRQMKWAVANGAVNPENPHSEGQ